MLTRSSDNLLHSFLCFMLLISPVLGDQRSAFSKDYTMMPGSERTLCIPGGSSLLYLFSYEEVSLSSNFGNIKYSVNGIDSSIFRFIESFFDSWSSIRLFCNRIFYDYYQRRPDMSVVFLSPYRRTCITLYNQYTQSEVEMRVTLRVERKISLLYPVMLTCSCLLFFYAKYLCTTQSFYYVTAMLLSPLSPLFLILRFTVSLFPRLHQIQVLCAILGLLTTLSLILRHSTYLWLMQTISDHPVFFILYYFAWILVSFFFMNWKLPLLTKRDIQQVYSWTRFVCLLVMINCTESVTVSIGIFVIFVLIAVLSGKLHWNHLWKEISILQSSHFGNVNDIDYYAVNSVRSQLLSLKYYLQENRELVADADPSLQTRLFRFIRSDELILLDNTDLISIQTLVNRANYSMDVKQRDCDTSSMILDDTAADAPFFGASSIPSLYSLWNAFTGYKKQSTQPKESSYWQNEPTRAYDQNVLPPPSSRIDHYQVQPPYTDYQEPFTSQDNYLNNRYYNTFKPMPTPHKHNFYTSELNEYNRERRFQKY